MTRIKVCGLTAESDALEAVHLGADAVGFEFRASSPRYIHPREAGRIVRRLPPLIAKVGVFVDPTAQEVLDAIAAAGLTVLQFHGDESPDFCRRFEIAWYRAFCVGPDFDPEQLASYASPTYLLEGASDPLRPGFRMAADLGKAAAARRYGRIILGGDLSPLDIGPAIAAVRPYAVDLAGNVEFSPGRKDNDLLETFIAAVRAADARLATRTSDPTP